MNPSKKPSFQELKVGIFVLVTCVILGAAIFTIGTQVGLLEDTFLARTYLNNVSGLKPGDIVLLAGVEAGNVTDVRITPPEDLPDTQFNQRFLAQIELLVQEAAQLEGRLSAADDDLQQVQGELDAAVEQLGENAPQVLSLREQVADQEALIERLSNSREAVSQETTRARGNLQNIVVMTEIRSEYRDWIRRDSNTSLGSIGLLGDKFIEISLGRGTEPPDVVIETVDRWYGSAPQEVVLITGTSQPGFQELITGADDALSNLSLLSDKLNNILEPLSEGRGTVGAFLREATFYDNLNQVLTSANQSVERVTGLIEDVRAGRGTLPRLIQEPEVYDKISESTGHLQEVLRRIEESEGSLGRFVNDPTLYDKGRQMMENIERITDRMDEGQGTLGKLSTDDQLYQDLRDSLARFNTFVSNIEQGKGTLGRLANDEELYRNLNQVSSEVIKMLYDFRQDPRKFLTIKLEIF